MQALIDKPSQCLLISFDRRLQNEVLTATLAGKINPKIHGDQSEVANVAIHVPGL